MRIFSRCSIPGLLIALCACSTPHTQLVTPNQADLLRRGVSKAEAWQRSRDADRERQELTTECRECTRNLLAKKEVLDWLRGEGGGLDPEAVQIVTEFLNAPNAAPDTDTVRRKRASELTEGQLDRLRDELLRMPAPAPSEAGATEVPPSSTTALDVSALRRLEEQERALDRQAAAAAADAKVLEQAEQGDLDFFTDKQLYFSIEPLVAIRPGIEAVAIPSLGVNYRPFEGGWSALAVQLVVGGALNPSGTEGSARGAIGAGFAYPVAAVGAISAGVVFYDDDRDGAAAPYLSITLGDFGEKRSRPGR